MPLFVSLNQCIFYVHVLFFLEIFNAKFWKHDSSTSTETHAKLPYRISIKAFDEGIIVLVVKI